MSGAGSPVTLNDVGRSLLRRHADWWQRKGSLYAEVQHAPLGPLWLPLAGGAVATEDTDLAPDMLDLDRLAGPPLEAGALELVGDLFRTDAPYNRVPWVEAILGAPIRATIRSGGMRARAAVAEWADWEAAPVHRDAGWFDLLRRLTELLVARRGGCRAIAHTLMRGPSDLAEALLGPEMLSLAMYDHAAHLERFLVEVTDAFIEILKEQAVRIPSIEGGCVNPFGIWAPGTVVRTQCDASAFLSPKHYTEWFLPYDVRISEAADYSIIHLHSCSLHTVSALLEVERPHAIQVVLETSPAAPPLEAMLPVFHRILALKPLVLDGPLSATDVALLQDQLPQDGLCVIARQAGW